MIIDRIVGGAALTAALGAAWAGCVSTGLHEKLHEDYQRLDEEREALQAEHERQAATLAQATAEAGRLRRELDAQAKKTSRTEALLEELRATQNAFRPAGADFVVVRLKGDILFASGKAELSAEAKKTLEDLAATLQHMPEDLYVRVDGHTDSAPIKTATQWQDNLDLSGARARAVYHFLKARAPGLQPRLFFAGYGEHFPCAENSSPPGMAQNRRVEVVVGPRAALGLVSESAE